MLVAKQYGYNQKITRIPPLEQPEWTQILLEIYNRKPKEMLEGVQVKDARSL